MGKRRNRTGWIGAFLALTVAVFALAPTVEAAVCGADPLCDQAHFTVQAGESSDDGRDGPDGHHEHGQCSHKLCQQGAVALPGAVLTEPQMPVASTNRAWPAAAGFAAQMSNGLERPPRF